LPLIMNDDHNLIAPAFTVWDRAFDPVP
jgi:hypothetical protein